MYPSLVNIHEFYADKNLKSLYGNVGCLIIIVIVVIIITVIVIVVVTIIIIIMSYVFI